MGKRRTEPVRSSGNRGLLGPSAQRESFTDDRPGERTPSHSEGGDKHASRDNHDDAGAFVLHRRTGSRDTGEDEQPGGLPDRTNDQGNSATKILNHVETRESSGHVNGTQDELDSDRVVDAGGLENGCSVL